MLNQVRVRFAPSPTGHYILVEFAPRYLIIYLPKKMAEFSF
jgi:hypothetical protein